MSQQKSKPSPYSEEMQLVGESEVVAYLQEHTDFFASNSTLLAELEVPHRSGGAVSLIERQVEQLRRENSRLQNEINTLLHVARENDSLSESMHRLTLDLLECEDSGGVVASLYESLRDHFGIEQVVVLLPHEENRETHDAFEQMLHDSVPFCGQLEEQQREVLFGEEMEHGASVALLPLGEFGKQGLIALGSSDAQHYHDKMGTHFLVQLSALVSTALLHCGNRQHQE